MSDQYDVFLGEGVVGSLSKEKLFSMRDDGRVTEETLICRVGDSAWKPIGEVFRSMELVRPAPPPARVANKRSQQDGGLLCEVKEIAQLLKVSPRTAPNAGQFGATVHPPGLSHNSRRLAGVVLLVVSLVGLAIGWEGLREIKQDRRNNEIAVSEIERRNRAEVAELDDEIASVKTLEDKEAAVRHATEAIAAERSRLAELKLKEPSFWEKRQHRNILYIFIVATLAGFIVGTILIVRSYSASS